MLVTASCFASVRGAVPGTGGATGSFGVPVPTTTPQNNGAAHGPRHPAYTDPILPSKLCRFCMVFVGLRVGFWLFFVGFGRNNQTVCFLAL